MTSKDLIFKFYYQGERPENPDDMAYILWTDDTVFNFSNYSNAYRQAAEALYKQFVIHKDDYAVKDTMGITLTFIYRHYMELTTKFLYLKFFPYIHGRRMNEDEIVDFIGKTSHNLNTIWIKLNPIMTELARRLKSTFDIKAFGHYVSEFQRFDDSSMKMRYPIDKNGKAVETHSQRLDIRILHDSMEECMNEVENLIGQWDDQIYWDENEELGQIFLEHFKNAIDDVKQFLIYESAYVKAYKKLNGAEKLKSHSFMDLVFKSQPEEIAVEAYLKTLSDNHLLVIHNLYYIGSIYLRRISVWKHAPDRQVQFRRSAGQVCRYEINKFNTQMDRGDLIGTIMGKMPETVYKAVKGCLDLYKRDLV